jgi:hypothetical protein
VNAFCLESCRISVKLIISQNFVAFSEYMNFNKRIILDFFRVFWKSFSDQCFRCPNFAFQPSIKRNSHVFFFHFVWLTSKKCVFITEQSEAVGYPGPSLIVVLGLSRKSLFKNLGLLDYFLKPLNASCLTFEMIVTMRIIGAGVHIILNSEFLFQNKKNSDLKQPE